MKERPILFQGAMVRAILDGSKTQTRRIMKPQPEPNPNRSGDHWWPCNAFQSMLSVSETRAPGAHGMAGDACPYGAHGDRLWVRESYRFTDAFNTDSPARVAERCLDAGYRSPWAPTHYEADCARRDWKHVGTPPHDGVPKAGKVRPSIHMPRWACRILLEIVSVRVERLQDISEPDARDEGITDGGCVCCGDPEPCGCPNPSPDARDAYCALWESINGAGSWAANPWVWVVEFKRVAP